MDVESDTTEKYVVCAYLFDYGDSIELIDSWKNIIKIKL